MGEEKEQTFWVPSGATLRLPPRMRLASTERERLWKGLERFVNCGDDLADYQALGRGFSDFWPVEIWHYPNEESHAPKSLLGLVDRALSIGRAVEKGELSEGEGQAEIKRMQWENEHGGLAWHPVCHKLFLFYRDTLREIWLGKRPTTRRADDLGSLADLAYPSPLGWMRGRAHEFLLGLTDYNEQARRMEGPDVTFDRPYALDLAWLEILGHFSAAVVEGRVEISMLWEIGDFRLVPNNDFQRAFYLLFRQNWRARVCPRCNGFFVARKQRQIFCGTGCSAGNRLATKRKWWNRVGAERRARERQRPSKRARRERKNR
jgi:hypothetical protein